MEAYVKLVLKSLLNCTDFSTLLTFICRLTSNVKCSENMPYLCPINASTVGLSSF